MPNTRFTPLGNPLIRFRLESKYKSRLENLVKELELRTLADLIKLILDDDVIMYAIRAKAKNISRKSPEGGHT